MAKPERKAGEFTYADYLTWPQGERWELLDGHAFGMAPPSIKHQIVVLELARQLANQLRGQRCKAFIAPVGVRLPELQQADQHTRSVLEPDLLVVCDPSKIDKQGIRGAPDFIVEVLSPSTASFDQIEKRRAYERAGVPELWLFDILSGVLTIYRRERMDAASRAFKAPEILRAEGLLAIAALPGISLDLEFSSELREQDEQMP